jgi:hypothetical protein
MKQLQIFEKEQEEGNSCLGKVRETLRVSRMSFAERNSKKGKSVRINLSLTKLFKGSFVGTIIWSSERRVYGGCLGVSRRRRPRQAARSDGEEQTSRDPLIAEWGNPPGESLVSVNE